MTILLHGFKLEGLLICGCFPTKTSNIHWKMSVYKWAWAVQTSVIQESAIHHPSLVESTSAKPTVTEDEIPSKDLCINSGSWNQYSTDTMGGLYFD